MKAYSRKIQFYLFLATVASIPFPVVVNRYLTLALGVATLFAFDWNSIKQNFNSERRILLAGIIVFINLLGLIYTDNTHVGFSLLERSAVTIIFPVIILMVKPTKEELNTILYVFVFTCLLVCFYCLFFSFWRIYQTDSLVNIEKLSDRPYYFFINNELTSKAMKISPIYLGLYVNLCIAFLLVKIFISKVIGKGDKVVLTLLHFFQVIIFSLSAMIALLSLWALVVIYIASRSGLARQIGLLVLFVVITGICFVGVYTIKPLHDRVFTKLQYDFELGHVSNWNGITLRLGVWDCAIEAAKETPIIGHGTGDADGILLTKYKERNFLLAELMELNAHNQYLQSYLMHGVIGLGVVLCILFMPLYHAILERKWLLIMFATMLFLGFFTEVILDVQKGLVFFSVFFPLLYLNSTQKK